MEEVRETLATAKLISLLDRETAAWTRNAKPKTCMDAGEIAHLFAADRPTTAYPKMRFDSKEKSGVPQPQPQPRLANKMSKEEIALAWDKDKGPRCFRCSEFGHVARECAKPRVKSDVKMEPKISNFGQKMSESSSAASSDSLHSSLGDAPLVMSGSVNGHPTHDMLRDTGTNQSVVEVDLIGPGYIQTGSVPIKSLHGTESHPTTDVSVVMNGYSFVVSMAVGHDFGHEVILGTDIPLLYHMCKRPRRVQPVRGSTRVLPPATSSEEEEDRITPEDLPPRRSPRGERTSSPISSAGSDRGVTPQSDHDVTPQSDNDEVQWAPWLDGTHFPNMLNSQANDPSLDGPRRTAGLVESLFYFNDGGFLCRKGDRDPGSNN